MTTADILTPAYFGVAGAVLGTLASFVPTYILERLKRKHETIAVTSAIVTEVRVTLFLIEKRGYVEGIETILAALRANEYPTAKIQIFFPDDLFPIYKANLSQIGIVPAAVRDDIVRFYQLLEAAIADVRPGGHIAANECGEIPLAQLHEIVSEAISIGKKITTAYPIKC